MSRLCCLVLISLAACGTASARHLLADADEEFEEVCSSSVGTFSVASHNFISKFTPPGPNAVTQLFLRDADLWNFR